MNIAGTPLLWGGSAVAVTIIPAVDLLLQECCGAHAIATKQVVV